MGSESGGVEQLFAEVAAELRTEFARIEWGENEIVAAQKRWPESADLLFHAFEVIRPLSDQAMGTESVYRAYARELLDRVGQGGDTRSGTAVEVCLGLRATSLRAPLNHEGFGLYLRMWAAAGLPEIPEMGDTATHYEAISASGINAAEEAARRAVRRPTRVLDQSVVCDGWHWGVKAPCRFAA